MELVGSTGEEVGHWLFNINGPHMCLPVISTRSEVASSQLQKQDSSFQNTAKIKCSFVLGPLLWPVLWHLKRFSQWAHLYLHKLGYNREYCSRLYHFSELAALLFYKGSGVFVQVQIFGQKLIQHLVLSCGIILFFQLVKQPLGWKNNV